MAKKRTPLEKLSRRATYWIGTTQCLITHLLICLIATILIPLVGFEKVLLVTTTLLSWEAVFLAIFIQMAVNRHGTRIKGIEDDIDDILEDTEQLTEDETN
jgi:low affinity Fe/Cu permease